MYISNVILKGETINEHKKGIRAKYVWQQSFQRQRNENEAT